MLVQISEPCYFSFKNIINQKIMVDGNNSQDSRDLIWNRSWESRSDRKGLMLSSIFQDDVTDFLGWCCTAERWSSSRKVSAQFVHSFLGHLTCCSLLSGIGCSVSLSLKQPYAGLKQPDRAGCSSAHVAPPGAGTSLRKPPAWATPGGSTQESADVRVSGFEH